MSTHAGIDIAVITPLSISLTVSFFYSTRFTHSAANKSLYDFILIIIIIGFLRLKIASLVMKCNEDFSAIIPIFFIII